MIENNIDPKFSLPVYVLVSPARNEAAFIAKTIETVAGQTVLPAKWVIVNDGSTDNTQSIVEQYMAKYDWIELVNRPVRQERNFAAKVHAFNVGQERDKDIPDELTANVDADVALDEDHFEFLLNKFKENPRLGVAGKIFRGEGGGR